MMRRPVDHLARVIAAALAALPFLCAGARAETSASVGLSGGVEYSNNPFLLTATNTDAVRARVSVSPSLQDSTGRSTLSVSGDASFSTYNRRYRDSVDLAMQVGYNNRVTQQLSIRAGMSVNSSIGSQYSTNPIFEAPSPTAVVPRIIDLTIVGLQDRTNQAQASAGVSYAIDNKNSISLGYDGSVVRYPASFNRNEYSNVRQNASYSRVVNSRVMVGASVGVSRVNYFGGPLGDAVIISPSLDGTFRLDSRWTLTAGVGFSSSRVNIGVGTLKSTDLSGSLNVCRSDTRTNFCFNGSRSTAASSFDGVRTTSTAGISYSYKINARDSLGASGGYSRSSAPPSLVGVPTDFLSASTNYSRRFSDRMIGNITGGFSRSTFQGSRSSAYVAFGINYSFGNR
jgi:hypothetical protein